MASFSAHKTGAPKGLGALYVKKDVRLKPLIFGGGQEKGLFCGTENIPAIAGWTEAVKTLYPTISARNEYTNMLKNKTEEKLISLGAEIISPQISSSHIITAAFPGYVSENIVHFLEKKEIYVLKTGKMFTREGNIIKLEDPRVLLKKQAQHFQLSDLKNSRDLLFAFRFATIQRPKISIFSPQRCKRH